MLPLLLLFSLSGVLGTSPLGSISDQSTSYQPTSSTTNSAISSSSHQTPVVQVHSAMIDLINLLGVNNTPVVDHVADTEDISNDSRVGNAYFRVAATVLLGLTKCRPDGEWIKSMFEFSNPEIYTNKGNDTAQVVLLGISEQGGEKRWTKELKRTNLEKVSAYEFDRDPLMDGANFDNPWWPWALIEGALEAGWSPVGIEDHLDDLLHILSGKEVVTLTPSESDQEGLWDDVFSKADSTPIFIKWSNAWSVVMSPSIRDGERWLGWADPYGAHVRLRDANNVPDGRLTMFTKYDTFAPITEILHLKDFSIFDGRPQDLQG